MRLKGGVYLLIWLHPCQLAQFDHALLSATAPADCHSPSASSGFWQPSPVGEVAQLSSVARLRAPHPAPMAVLNTSPHLCRSSSLPCWVRHQFPVRTYQDKQENLFCCCYSSLTLSSENYILAHILIWVLQRLYELIYKILNGY